MEETIFSPANILNVSISDTSVEVNSNHQRMTDDIDLLFNKNTVNYFGYNVEVIGTDSINLNNTKPTKSPGTNRTFSRMIDTVLNNPDTVFKNGISKKIKVTYNLEKGRLRFLRGFKLGKY
jgi:hypothetical protein